MLIQCSIPLVGLFCDSVDNRGAHGRSVQEKKKTGNDTEQKKCNGKIIKHANITVINK